MEFIKIYTEELSDIASVGHVYSHPTGARLAFIENNDDNMVFSATFRTPVSSDNGVAHIVEHCLFCGSEKYRAQDTFSELSKGSMRTYMNAMTFRDRTMYPVASRNPKDFRNLMEVYLDAVFKPLLRKESFIREGWHYVKDAAGNITGAGGIVFNEMTGAYSTPTLYLEHAMNRCLFTKTEYAFDAGGVPEKINPTYEEFLEFYKRCYSPDNCYFYLYGNVELDKTLEHINEYISHYPESAPRVYSHGVSSGGVTALSDSNSEIECTAIKYAIAIPETKFAFGLRTLHYYLLRTPSSPLRRRLLQMADDLDVSLDQELPETVLSIVLKDTELSPMELKYEVTSVLAELYENGVDTELMTACLNKLEFAFREGRFSRPKGLVYNMELMRSWIYGGGVFDRLQWKRALRELRSDMGYFREIIRDGFLENSHWVLGCLIPGKMKTAPAPVTAPELEPDSPEVLAAIPALRISDINNRPEMTEIVSDGVLYAPESTNGILYGRMYFNTDKVETLPYIGILDYLLTSLPTKNYSLRDLTAMIGRDLGGMRTAFHVYGRCAPKLIVYIKALTGSKIFDHALELGNTVFEDKEEIRGRLVEYASKLEISFVNSGHILAASRAKAYFGDAYAYEDQVKGFGLYQFLKSLLRDFDARFEGLKQGLYDTMSRIFTRENLTLGLICEEKDYPMLRGYAGDYIAKLNDRVSTPAVPSIYRPCISEGISAAARVQHVASARRLNTEFSGALVVLAQALESGYLLDEVRLKGGAYGAFCTVNRRGLICFSSYRDPHLERTVQVYRRAFDNLKAADAERLIVGAAGRYLRPRHPCEKGDFALAAWLNGISRKDIMAEFDGILAAEPNELTRLARGLSDAEMSLCAVGSREKITNMNFEKVFEM